MTRAAVTLLILFAAADAHSEDWPHWRGPDRNDVSAEPSGWDGTSWIRGELWKFAAGEGSSSPLVVGDRVYLTGWSDEHDSVFCLDAASGRVLWTRKYPSPRYGRFSVGDKSLYSGACSTPEYEPATGLLYTLGVDGDLIAWDTKHKGRRVWSVNIYDQYGAKRRPEVAERRKTQRDYGYMSSPCLFNEQLIVEVGGKSGNLVAFDPHDGRELWTSENRDEAGHTGGPVPIDVDGVPCVAVLTLRHLVVTRIDGPNAGRTVAVHPWTTDFGNNIATPAVHGNSVIVTSAYNHFAMCRLDITLNGAKQVWQTNLASGVCSPVIHDGRVYWAWRGVHCVDFATGEELWAGGHVGSQGSCIVTGDERLVVYANKGDLLLGETAKRSPDSWTQLASHSVLSQTDAWPHVVLANERLICRDRNGSVRCVAVAPGLAPSRPEPDTPKRMVRLKGGWPGTREGLLIAWDRELDRGQVLTGFEQPSVRLKPREAAGFTDDGGLQFDGGAFLLSGGERPLTAGSQRANRISIESVITSARPRQSGPARIVTFSSDGYSRNFTIGQEGDELILRLRTTRTGNNGMNPQVTLGQIPAGRRIHLVISYRPGQLDCWINGRRTVSTDQVQGDFSNWDAAHHLLLGDEWDGGEIRKWRGRIDRLSVYARAMTDAEVHHRYELAGSPD